MFQVFICQDPQTRSSRVVVPHGAGNCIYVSMWSATAQGYPWTLPCPLGWCWLLIMEISRHAYEGTPLYMTLCPRPNKKEKASWATVFNPVCFLMDTMCPAASCFCLAVWWILSPNHETNPPSQVFFHNTPAPMVCQQCGAVDVCMPSSPT